ncbi:RluA family pseudouridine synthase [Chrysiogenes arsenatis]|uniref:RluA family pseudouridine synthase n=1 Tax=Chrysiogenes arsenatis TaxID=309797 RepID=UPI000428CF5C|nr:RluA family pseudouridine synthase [Chrysiogenes arsenatis]
MDQLHLQYELTTSERLDKYLADNTPITRSGCARLIENGHITVNGVTVTKPSAKLHAGYDITVTIPEPEHLNLTPENIPLDIRYEDEHLLVINKPAGLVVHPAAGNWSGTLVNGLLYYLHNDISPIGGVLRPGIVHRLDKDTSGLMIVAKSEAAHLRLVEMFSNKEIERHYLALVHGKPQDSGTISGNIGRDPRDRKKMAIVEAPLGKHAITHYTTLERFLIDQHPATYIRCQLDTGRTHQIRVHLRSIHAPLIADELYGYGTEKRWVTLRRQALHSATVRFHHPIHGEWLECHEPLPEDMEKQLNWLRQASPFGR